MGIGAVLCGRMAIGRRSRSWTQPGGKSSVLDRFPQCGQGGESAGGHSGGALRRSKGVA